MTTSFIVVTLSYQLNNHLGSVSLEVDEDARIISYEEYFPYGGTAFIAGKTQKEVKLKDYRYSGKERDDSTGLYYYGARYYAPWLGRWLTADPAGTVDGLNVYGFVGGNPVIFQDASGLRTNKRTFLEAFETLAEKAAEIVFGSKRHKSESEPLPLTSMNLWGRMKPGVDNQPTSSNQPRYKSYKRNTIRTKFKGTRDPATNKTSGVELCSIKSLNPKWSVAHTDTRDRFGNNLASQGNISGRSIAENSHIIATSFGGPNDLTNAAPAGNPQNTVWLQIETGLRALIKGLKGPIVKATGYIHDGSDPDHESGTLKAARMKIYLPDPQKALGDSPLVFDYVAMGNRGNIDPNEGNRLRAHVESLTSSSPPATLHKIRWLSSPKGLSGATPPKSTKTVGGKDRDAWTTTQDMAMYTR